MRLLILAFVFVSVFVAAQMAEAACVVNSLRDAKTCMYNFASQMDEGNSPSEGFASLKINHLTTLMSQLGQSKPQALTDASFVGAVVVYSDEIHILYYALKSGKDVTPEQVYDLNIVELSNLMKQHQVTAQSPLADAQYYFLGVEGKRFRQAYDDLKEAIKIGLGN
jgi:hypothetical protein